MIPTKRRRGNMLKFIRLNHERQLERMDDFELLCAMQDIGAHMNQEEVTTMLQDLGVFGFVTYSERYDPKKGRVVLEKIMLTSAGVSLTTRRRNTDEVIFD